MYLVKNGSSELADWLKHETTLDTELAIGASGLSVRRVQEWLTLHDHGVAVDGVYGAITASELARFQERASLPDTGKTDRATFSRLVAPLEEALRPQAHAGQSMNAAVLAHARKHLAQRPREVGGQNRGPWVRMYMDGREGAEWAWCAGFVTFVLRQASESLGAPMPIAGSVSCDTLAAQAKAAGLFVSQAEASRRTIPAGSIFLVRRTEADWTHVGIVDAAEPTSFRTIEGNSNDSGDREGYEVCRNSRGYADKDFILLAR
jgi:peptidoglycan hydrolase-like protein with peptidoglycan-binding domain